MSTQGKYLGPGQYPTIALQDFSPPPPTVQTRNRKRTRQHNAPIFLQPFPFWYQGIVQ